MDNYNWKKFMKKRHQQLERDSNPRAIQLFNTKPYYMVKGGENNSDKKRNSI